MHTVMFSLFWVVGVLSILTASWMLDKRHPGFPWWNSGILVVCGAILIAFAIAMSA